MRLTPAAVTYAAVAGSVCCQSPCGTRTHRGLRQCTIPCHTLGLPPPTGRERHLLCPPRMVMRPPVRLQCELLPAVRAAAARRRRQLKYCQILDRAQELRFFDPENPGSAAPARRRRVPTRAGGQIPQLSQYVWQLMNPFVECCRDHAQSSQMGASMGVDITGAPPSACPDLLKVPCAATSI